MIPKRHGLSIYSLLAVTTLPLLFTLAFVVYTRELQFSQALGIQPKSARSKRPESQSNRFTKTSRTESMKHSDVNSDVTNSDLAELAKKKALENRLIISVVDTGYLEMAFNLWETSFVKFGIENYLFVCMEVNVRSLLPPGANGCFVATEDQDGNHPSRFGTSAFNRKVMIKTKVSLELLYLGYTVIVVDLDIVFFRNPLPYLHCNECDLLIQDDGAAKLNTGFYMVKPIKSAMELLKEAVEKTNQPNHASDQDILNELVLQQEDLNKLKVALLDSNIFQSGNLYFSDERNFAYEADCSSCIIVHNNWVIGLRSKVYRFKEMLLWVVDTDGYYTSTVNKYITYYNPKESNREQEKRALELAFQVGKLLNRIVIIPKFNCPERLPSKHCHLLRAFGSGYLESKKESTYRESVFLQHPKVPTSTKHSISPEVNSSQLTRGISYPEPVLAEIISEAVLSNQTLDAFRIVNFSSLIL